ncbi:MAG: V-type ATPase subunit [Candidatus Micrarchaeia archaeon]
MLNWLPRLESRSLKYGYSNARVKAMKGSLIKSGYLEEMVKVGSVEAMVELLQRSGYKNDLSGASVQYGGSALIEAAASKNFSRTVRKLIKISPKSDRSALEALLIRYDLMNLKTLMHARRVKKGFEDVRPNLIEVGGMSEDDFKRILKADDRDVVREVRKTGFGRTLLSSGTEEVRQSMAKALSSIDMFTKMESGIDSYIYLLMDHVLAKVPAKEASYIRGILRNEIDARNILIIERLKKHNSGKEKIRSSLIKGGTIKDQMVERMIEAKDIAAVLQLSRSRFHHLDLKEIKSLSELEINLEKSIAAEKAFAFSRAVLSAGVIIGFLLLKEEEVNNLRKIAKGKEFGLSEAEIRAMLVVV